MIESILLLFLVATLAIFVYFANEGDILCPAVIACLAFLICCAGAIYDCWAWNTQISLTTVLVVIVGLISFVLPATIMRLRLGKNIRTDSKSIEVNSDSRWRVRVNIPVTVTCVVCLFGAIASYIYIQAIVSSVGMRATWSETMQAYRWHTSFDETFSTGIPTIVNYAFRLFMAFGYVYLFFFINNLVVGKVANWSYLLPPSLYCIASLGQSSRGQIIVMMFSGVLMYWILRSCASNGGHRISFDKVVLLCVILVAGFTVFVLAGSAVGRVTAKTPFDSLMTYIGGSIVGLDQFIAKPQLATTPSDLFGAETLQGIWLFLGKAFNVPEWTYTFQLEYRYVNNINIGNLYTAFRYYLHDFGLIGMCVIVALQGWLFGALYSSLANPNSKIRTLTRIVLTIVFSWIGISIAYLPIADFLFHQYLNPTSILTIILIVISTSLILKLSNVTSCETVAISAIDGAQVLKSEL